MAKTKIEWADKVWNPTVGCTKVSSGCKNCYAERIYERFHPGQKFSEVHCIPGRLNDPLHWEKPARIFVDSMSDLFHKDVPEGMIDGVFYTMLKASQHIYIILTKRPERMLTYMEHQSKYMNVADEWPNVWLGVSVEDQKTADERIPLLLQTPAALRFVSVEPMLGPIDLDGEKSDDLHALGCGDKECTCGDRGLDWVICGCESGPGARPMEMDWARLLRVQCQVAGVPFFLKQAKIDGKLVKMPELDGKIWDELPGKRDE